MPVPEKSQPMLPPAAAAAENPPASFYDRVKEKGHGLKIEFSNKSVVAQPPSTLNGSAAVAASMLESTGGNKHIAAAELSPFNHVFGEEQPKDPFFCYSSSTPSQSFFFCQKFSTQKIVLSPYLAYMQSANAGGGAATGGLLKDPFASPTLSAFRPSENGAFYSPLPSSDMFSQRAAPMSGFAPSANNVGAAVNDKKTE